MQGRTQPQATIWIERGGKLTNQPLPLPPPLAGAISELLTVAQAQPSEATAVIQEATDRIRALPEQEPTP
jgi:hypothetical protein